MAGLDPCWGAGVHRLRLGKEGSCPPPPVPVGLSLQGASKGPEGQTSEAQDLQGLEATPLSHLRRKKQVQGARSPS